MERVIGLLIMATLTHCKRCGIEFEDNNEAVECPECDCLTLCEMCAQDNICCDIKDN